MSQTESNGMDLASWLLVLFVALKLLGVIHWSWWWVTSPIWIPLVVAAGFFVVAGLFALTGVVLAYYIGRRRR